MTRGAVLGCSRETCARRKVVANAASCTNDSDWMLFCIARSFAQPVQNNPKGNIEGLELWFQTSALLLSSFLAHCHMAWTVRAVEKDLDGSLLIRVDDFKEAECFDFCVLLFGFCCRAGKGALPFSLLLANGRKPWGARGISE